ncbi:uncharacterized protein PRCAT00005656001 [Priceomyces carsonii]|uniref:uncharacterized protein n=1 Tax=Priceomyces carsonii TaxID=28549 RepID=UPI002ED9E5BE|nr:unnamed protein product [Priceomyces carsonii]
MTETDADKRIGGKSANRSVGNAADVLTHTVAYNESIGSNDTDDDYDLSEEDNSNEEGIFHKQSSHPIHFTASLSDHAEYITNNLVDALDSQGLDESLVLQAKISGRLNNENQKVIERRKELNERLKSILSLYKKNFTHSERNLKSNLTSMTRVQKLKHDIDELESRIEKLKNGSSKSFRIFKLQYDGISKSYPVEYNQSKDKILERQIDEL